MSSTQFVNILDEKLLDCLHQITHENRNLQSLEALKTKLLSLITTIMQSVPGSTRICINPDYTTEQLENLINLKFNTNSNSSVKLYQV